MLITPNITFTDNCREGFEAYARILGADRLELVTFGQMQQAPDLGADWSYKIAHAWLQIGGQAIMGSDSPPGVCAEGDPGAASGSVALHFDDAAKARVVFDALSEGGQVQMPFGTTEWSPGFGMCRDRFGKDWMINTTTEPTQ